MRTQTAITADIKQRAHSFGFEKVGIARAESLTVEALRLQEWLARGFHASMHWMVKGFEKRTDPRNILPEARSVICVAMNYNTSFNHSECPESGKISRYAWGEDYHEIVTSRLNHLLRSINESWPDSNNKLYVDTGPVLDKVWAQRAGLGWQGKHTNLITQDYGSWVFLGEILTSLELEYDEPGTDHCGDCTLCIEACPTDALVEPYVLDSSRCISYLTIEHRGDIGSELAEKFEGWVYGCDICQDVCPWNIKFSQESRVAEFRPRTENLDPDLNTLSEMTEEQFRRMYKGSPMKRTKHSGLTRNAKLALAARNRHGERKEN